MLVLTRKSQEQIRIGDDIVVTIIRVKGNSVRVGIEAPRDVRVVRGELPPKIASTETAVETAIELPREERLELPELQVERVAEGVEDTTPAERAEQNFRPRRTLKEYVATTITHAV